MEWLINALMLIVIVSHVYFLVLEMFLWTKPIGLKIFGQSKAQAESSKVLAANQGLYNGFLAAGLLYGFIQGEEGLEFKYFFLICIVIAGIYGGLTANRKIITFQALPALICLLLLYFTM
jgi:putative membrane protein